MTETNASRETPEEDGIDPVWGLIKIAGMLVVLIGLIGVVVTFMYGVGYEMASTAQVETTDTSGVVDAVDVPGGQSFVVTFAPEIQEGGPTKLTIIGPEGEIKYRTDLAPGVQTAELPEEGLTFAFLEHDAGSYRVVATHGNEVYGEATVQIESHSLLPLVPLGRLFKYGLVVGVLAVAVMIGGVVRGD